MRTVLLVEDDPSTIRLLEVQLGHAGFNTIESRDVGKGWKALQENQPDAVIVDIALPGAFGWELIERMRRDKRFAQTPVIVLSGVLGPDEIRRATQFDCRWVEKPFDPDDLLAEVRSLIGYGRQLERITQMVRIVTSALIIDGHVHLPPDRARFSDGFEEIMRDERGFLSVTDARVSGINGGVVAEAAFFYVAKSNIHGVSLLGQPSEIPPSHE